MLSRELAHRNHYPAIDVLAVGLAPGRRDHAADVRAAGGDALRELLATYRAKEDLITIGAYQRGSRPATSTTRSSCGLRSRGFLRQGIDEPATAADADRTLLDLMAPRARATRFRLSRRRRALTFGAQTPITSLSCQGVSNEQDSQP